MHRKAAEIWEEDRKALLEDRVEKERLKVLDDEHREEKHRWALTQEQLLKERSDSNAQLQLGLQQLEQQQKSIEVHNQEKAQWLKEQDAHVATRSKLESRVAALEEELNSLKLNNSSLSREKEDLTAKLERSEQDLTESGRHLAAARSGAHRLSARDSAPHTSGAC
jgi:chromosome segregation ATPase